MGSRVIRGRFRWVVVLGLVVTAGLSVFVAGFGGALRRLWQEYSVGARVRRLGGEVHWQNMTVTRASMKQTQLTEEMTRDLNELPNLTIVAIYLPDKPSDEQWLRELAKLDGLRELFVEGWPSTDADIAHLNGPRSLRKITFYLSDITDEGIGHLRMFPNLQEVRVYRSRVTQEGVTALQRSLPNVRVGWEGNVLPGDLEGP